MLPSSALPNLVLPSPSPFFSFFLPLPPLPPPASSPFSHVPSTPLEQLMLWGSQEHCWEAS